MAHASHILGMNARNQLYASMNSNKAKRYGFSKYVAKEFLARQGILIEGYSLPHKEKFSKRLGFIGYSIFTYNLLNLNHNEKTKFTYALIGRNNEGILKITNSNQFGKGSISVPIENSEMVEDFMKKWKVNYRKKKILIAQS